MFPPISSAPLLTRAALATVKDPITGERTVHHKPAATEEALVSTGRLPFGLDSFGEAFRSVIGGVATRANYEIMRGVSDDAYSFADPGQAAPQAQEQAGVTSRAGPDWPLILAGSALAVGAVLLVRKG